MVWLAISGSGCFTLSEAGYRRARHIAEAAELRQPAGIIFKLRARVTLRYENVGAECNDDHDEMNQR